MTNNQFNKEPCKYKIENQFKKRRIVEYNKTIPDTNASFDIVCYEKKLITHFLPPELYIVFDIFDHVDCEEVEAFRNKVNLAASKIDIAYICLKKGAETGPLFSDKILQICAQTNPPISYLSC